MMQKGFSLPEITVALGLVAGVSLVTMKLVENNARNQNTLKASAEIQKAVSILKSSLNDPERCRSILRGQLVTEVANNTLQGSPLGANVGNPALGVGLFQEIRDGGGTSFKELLKPNTAYPGFRTSGITLRRITGSPADTAELVVNFANETDLNMRNDGTIAQGDKGTRIVIPLVAKLDATNRITDCTPSISEVNESAREKFCKSLGNLAVWDSLGTPKTCKFRTHKCPEGQVPSVFKSTGELKCEPLSEQIDPNALFDETPCNLTSGNMRIEAVGGKLRLNCN